MARHNRELADRVHRLTLDLLVLESVAERIERLRVSLRRDFSVDSAALVLFRPVPRVGENERFVKVMHRRDPRLKVFDGWLDPSRPRGAKTAEPVPCRSSQVNRVARDAGQQVFPRGCRGLAGVAGKYFSQEPAER